MTPRNSDERNNGALDKVSDPSGLHSVLSCERPESPRCVIMAVSKEVEHHPFRASKASTEPRKPDKKKARHQRCAGLSSARAESQHGGPSLDELNSSLSKLRGEYGSFHPRLGALYNQLGTHYFHQGKYEDARPAYDKALECYKQSYARKWRFFRGRCNVEESLDIATTFSNIGAVLWRTGNANSAITYLEQALDMQKSAAAASRNDSVGIQAAHTLYNLGSARCLRGEYREALRALKRAKRTYEKEYGPFHIEVACIEDAIGTAHASQGYADKAIKCHQNALRIKAATLDVYDSSVRSSMMKIAAVYCKIKKFEKAELLYKEVRCASKIALYMEVDPSPEYVQAIISDYDAALILHNKVRWQKGLLECEMPTIEEEEEAKE